ncbi:MAG: hypothetical protein II405_05095 [Oscillospiraceae bacterium]|nr:hypothetical protein [Oscillospiraceae bacterium]
MARKQRIICLLLAAWMVFCLAACKGNDSGSSNPNPPANSTGENQQPGAESGSTSQNADPAEGAKLTGKLDLINLDDRDPSVLRGVRINGLSVGTADSFNGREASLTDVRCIFELGEWIEFYPDTDKEYALRVWVLKHRDDQAYYNTCKFSDLMPNFANYCDLHYPEDADNPDEWYWGSFYLNQEECEPGYYDFVFTYEGKAIAVLLTRFYAEGELSAKSDAELEALMHE